MKHAIILAAGVGSRLGTITKDRPKCCVEVAGKPLIRHIIDQLVGQAPEIQIKVAAGYLVDAVHDAIASYGSQVEVVENKDYAITNNMESCRMVLDNIYGHEGAYIINGDCIYDSEIIEKMIKITGNAIAVDSSQYYEENMKIELIDGCVRDISKELPNKGRILTSIDFYKFERNTLFELHSIMNTFKQRGDVGKWTEVAIAELVKNAACRVKACDISGWNWVEIDNYDDLEKAHGLWA